MWGESWGKNARGEIPEKMMRYFLLESGDACQLHECRHGREFCIPEPAHRPRTEGVLRQPGHSLAPCPAASGSLCPKPGLKHLLSPGLEGGEAAQGVSRKHREVWCKEGCSG